MQQQSAVFDHVHSVRAGRIDRLSRLKVCQCAQAHVQQMEEALEAAITAENYDLAAQLGLDTDTLRAELGADDGTGDNTGVALASLWTEMVLLCMATPSGIMSVSCHTLRLHVCGCSCTVGRGKGGVGCLPGRGIAARCDVTGTARRVAGISQRVQGEDARGGSHCKHC